MNKYIVTTSIYQPSIATQIYAHMKDWIVIMVGDLKTPHQTYESMDLIYIHPDQQEKDYEDLSDAIGWNCVMRRNIGFIEAFKRGADIIATIDDDNIPYDTWGKDIRIGSNIPVDIYTCDTGAFDPMQLTNHPELWHRGYPLSYIQASKHIYYAGKTQRKILFQADLWDGDPDIDAVCRLTTNVSGLKLTIKEPFTSTDYMPFNSQNTFIAREAIPYYMVLPYVGRMDDIWGGYIAQHVLSTRPVFMPATVYQQRNIQSIKKNLRDEVLGYNETADLLMNMDHFVDFLPEATKHALSCYQQEYKKLGVMY